MYAGNILLLGEAGVATDAAAEAPADAAIVVAPSSPAHELRGIAESRRGVRASARSGARERMDATPDSGLKTAGGLNAPTADPSQHARFEQTVMPHLSAAHNLARWLVRDDHAAEDIVQEAYLRAHKSFASLRGIDARPWLLAIVRNMCFTWHQQQRHRRTLSFDEALHDTEDQAIGPSAALVADSEAERIRTVMNELPAEFREAIVLRAVEGLSYKQIADLTGVPVGTVMSRLARARQRLEHFLDDTLKPEAGHELP